MSAPLPLSQNRSWRKLAWALPCLVIALAGCPSRQSPEEDGSGGLPPRDVKLTLVVVDDPGLAAAIEPLRAEWAALASYGYQVRQVSQAELIAGDALGADAIICPSALLGALAEKRQVVPVPESLLQDEQGSGPDVFSLLRIRETVWSNDVLGVPFGSPVLTIYYRVDLLEKLGLEPPRTWAEYGKLAQRLSNRDDLGEAAPPKDAPWCGAIEPLGPGWAGVVLLARAAPYATHRENYSTLFDVDTMQPLIDGPPFVRALEELVATAALGPPEQLTLDPAAARAAFWQGRCGMAMSWPTATFEPSSAEVPGIRPGFAELPGSTEAFDVAQKTWEPRPDDEDPHVPLLAVAGRVGLVTAGSKWPEAAFRLLFWLSREQSTEVSPSSPAATLFRSSHVGAPRVWVEPAIPPPAAAQYAEMTQQALSRPQYLFALRIPGRMEYLSALDQAVHQAVRGEKAPQEALRQAAAKWREITERLGLEAQRQAYWNSLGLE